VTYRRSTKAAAEISPAQSDLAFLYVSRWKSPQAAERFARFYASAVSQRYRSATAQASLACSGANCPVSTVQIATEEGPVIVEHWADNSVVVSESFDQTTAAKLRDAVRDGTAAVHADNVRNDNSSEDELGSRLYEIPAFRHFQTAIEERIAEGMTSSLVH
jgi:hypothetical protein